MEKSSFFNSVSGDRKYKAEEWAEYFASFIGNGIFPEPSTNLMVEANAGMTLTIKAGKAWINGYFYYNTDDFFVVLDNADGLLKRIDRIVVRWSLTDRKIEITVKKGAFASSPVAPTLQRDADIYELALADIAVNNGAIQITQANITDHRQNSSYCGIVAGTVDQIDATDLFNQYEAAFNEWFIGIQTVLGDEVAGNLLNLINQNTADIESLETEKANQADLNITNATLADMIPLSQKGATSGVASLDSDGLIIQGLSYRMLFGSGVDGDVTIAANTTLTRNMYYNNLTINNGVTLTTDGFNIYVRNTLTNNGTILVPPLTTTGGSGGGTAKNSSSNGGAGNAGSALLNSAGGIGGNGGNMIRIDTGVNSSAGGAGGTRTSTVTASHEQFGDIFHLLLRDVSINGGTGGGSGSTWTYGISGAGGIGGGVLIIRARILNNNGVIRAKGQNGFNATIEGGTTAGDNSAAGGGGGGGGVIVLVYRQLTNIGTTDVTGGAGGTGISSPYYQGQDGAVGNLGAVIQLNL